MKDLLKAFSLTLREWQNIKAMLLHIKQNGRTTNELISHIDTMVVREIKFKENQLKQIKQLTKPCPTCQAPMRLLPVNFSPATLTGEDSKSVWLCPNKACMHTECSTKTVQEQINTPR